MSVMEMERLDLREAVASPPIIRPDGLVGLHIIRPGIGKGRGKHLYEADMLAREANAGRFQGWKMYLDHQSPEAKRAAGGLPRSIRDLAGVVREAWWDPNVPADPSAGHGQGAVVGLARVNRFVRELVEDIPEALGTSISAQATNVRPKMVGGQQVWLVEGIQPRGSVDFVTEPGAGGRVAALMEHALEESWFEDDDARGLLLEAADADEIAELLSERPDLMSALREAFSGEGHVVTVPRAVRETKEVARTMGENNDALLEALQSEDGKAAMRVAVEEAFAEIVAPKLAELIEAVLTDERELLAADASASSARQIEVRDLRDAAHQQIAESKLPETLKTELREQYDVVNGKPTLKLDVTEAEIDGVTKSAREMLTESLATDIAKKRAIVAEIRPTRVTGQGPTPEGGLTEGAEGGKKEQKGSGSPLTDHLLTEARIESPEGGDLWADIPANA